MQGTIKKMSPKQEFTLVFYLYFFSTQFLNSLQRIYFSKLYKCHEKKQNKKQIPNVFFFFSGSQEDNMNKSNTDEIEADPKTFNVSLVQIISHCL